jgi:hypothetical protein
MNAGSGTANVQNGMTSSLIATTCQTQQRVPGEERRSSDTQMSAIMAANRVDCQSTAHIRSPQISAAAFQFAMKAAILYPGVHPLRSSLRAIVRNDSRSLADNWTESAR